jgi:hypothetical protein
MCPGGTRSGSHIDGATVPRKNYLDRSHIDVLILTDNVAFSAAIHL